MVDYGPLQALIGSWRGSGGMDLAPEPDGEAQTPYNDAIEFEAIGDVNNAEEQTLVALRYHQVVRKQVNGDVFHNETGYFSWEPQSGVMSQSFSIPRGVAVVATGGVTEEDGWIHIDVHASAEQISQTAFMDEKAKTTAFSHRISVKGDELRYTESTTLEIYGRRFEHTDGCVLHRVP